MTRRAVLICPGRGTYNKDELGYLARHHTAKTNLIAGFDAQRRAAGQPEISALDGAKRFLAKTYSQGDVASPLIYACAMADAQDIPDDIDVVAVTGNSMGWYIALAAAGALSPAGGFQVVNTMGTLMQEQLIGGQLVYPFTDDDWRTHTKQALLDLVASIHKPPTQTLYLSIDLGGMLVLAGNEQGLSAFETAVPAKGRFPMRLSNHAAFHTPLQMPIARQGRAALGRTLFRQPLTPIIDGRGHIWWPHATDISALWDYTLGHQVTASYDFTRAVQTAAREFAPDLFIITGPGNTLGGAVAQSLVLGKWQNMQNKADFQTRQTAQPFLYSMGLENQRAQLSG